ncbi:MAG TPA: transporter, partial [Myxococcota bacterium]|nr:transporter [Myxococcota bacterium]
MGALEPSTYWPWWLGALALGGLSVLHMALTGKILGVSGAWKRVVRWRAEAAAVEAEEALRTQSAALLAELEAATRAEFGDRYDASAPTVTAPVTSASAPAAAITPGASALFLAMVALGGAISAAAAGRWGVRADLGAEFARVVASGWAQWPALGFGGILVGLGTSMAGGCTSGHGVMGCARLQVSSL